ncbi:MAG: TRIC cation channel family protein [Selenomonas artemidis]|nr:TRIC cation channel family protein [Selenomonas artemidis]
MIGTIAFAVSGTLVGISRRMDIFGISVLALATAVGGGMIRDVLASRMPVVLYAEVYAGASLAGAFVFCLLRPVLGVEVNSWLAFTLALLIRFAAIRGNWSLYHPRPPRRKR